MMSQKLAHKARWLIVAMLVLVALVWNVFTPRQTTYAASTIAINGATTYQTMDGFGFSDAFGPAHALQLVSSSTEQKQILDLLFSPTTGAGMTILRNLLPSDASHTIEPTSPGSPGATPTYTWDGSSWGQIWLSQQAQTYGVSQFYGDAWSAPGFMKTNGDEANGGQLCGSPGAATCSTGDWRQAYANYLLQYYKDYQSAGIPLTQLGAFNEPNFTATYSSMVMNPTQTADFVGILGPTLQAAGVSPQIVCCDGEGWDTAQSYANGITSNATANSYTGIFSSHGYTAPPNSALTGLGSKHVWETEWSKFDASDNTWDDGGDGSGFYWAQQIYTGITAANLSAFLYWWGVNFNGTDNGYLVNDVNGTVVPSMRLWSFANYSLYVRPGAIRIGTTSNDPNLEVTSYKNTDGTLSVVVLNQAYAAIPATFSLSGVTLPTSPVATPYVTDASNTTAAQTALAVQNGSFSTTIGSRQLVTFKIATGTAPTPTPTPATPTTPTPVPAGHCNVHYAIGNQWNAGFTATVNISNTGTTDYNGWTLQFSFPGNQVVTSSWNGVFTQQGELVTISSKSYNAVISAGKALDSPPGFNGSWSGTNAVPTAFTLNGTLCTST